MFTYILPLLTHWGRVTYICVGKLTIIASDNALSPGRRQAVIWNNAGILLIRNLGTNFSEILGEIHSFSFSKMHLKMSSAKWRLFGLGLNEFTHLGPTTPYGENVVYIIAGKGTLPEGTNKAASQPMITNHQWGLMAFTYGQSHMKCSITTASARGRLIQWITSM